LPEIGQPAVACGAVTRSTSGNPRSQDRIEIGREAHSLKSSAGTFGYRELARLAKLLERDAGRLSDVEYRHLLDRMDAAHVAATARELQR
jgi:HPt (histidine-containing phosphotransfer) domain-containing protein